MHKAEAAFRETMSLTELDKVDDLTLPELENYCTRLSGLRWALYGGVHQQACDMRMDLLWGKIEQKRSDLRHKEAIGIGRWTLFWAIIGGIAAAVGTLVLLFHDTPLSKLLPARASQASPTSSPQAIATSVPLESPMATESQSESPPASPTPELTSMPTLTPIKFPPPAP